MKTKDLIQYVETVPPTLPADSRKRPRLLVDAVDDFISANYNKDPSLRQMALSLNTTDSLYGGAVDDKVMLAHKIKVDGDKSGDPAIKAATVHMIRVNIQPALRRHGQSRTQRLRVAEKKRLEALGAPQPEAPAPEDNGAA